MKIELFTFVFNDEDLLPFFLRHYASIVDKMTFIDSGSTDKTLELIKDHKVVQTGLTWWDWDKLHGLRNTIWKQSNYDLVFFPDIDEFLYRQDLRGFLEKNTYDIYQVEGFQMISESFPKPGTDILNINLGVPYPLYNKYIIFNPKVDVFFPDAHNVKTTSDNISKFEIKLLHYQHLGVDSMLKRSESIKKRVPSDSYTIHIRGNILDVFPHFVRYREECTANIKQLLLKATKVI